MEWTKVKIGAPVGAVLELFTQGYWISVLGATLKGFACQLLQNDSNVSRGEIEYVFDGNNLATILAIIF